MLKNIEKLVERCIAREERAWEELIERFSGLLYYSARERLRRNGIAFGQEDIEDIVQGVFLEIWERKRLEEIRERKKIGAWLSIMAQTRAINYMRKKKERLLHQKELYKIDNIEARSDAQIDEKVAVKLERIIENFEPREKIIFKLSVTYGKKHKDIARFMGIPINTVSTIIARKKKIVKDGVYGLSE